MVTSLDILNESFLDDPYPTYAAMRADESISYLRNFSNTVIISRLADVEQILKDPNALIRPELEGVPKLYCGGPAGLLWKSSMSLIDGVNHTRLRRVVSGALSPTKVLQLAPLVESTIQGALDEVLEKRVFDGVSEFSSVIPMKIICSLLQIPESDWGLLESWTADFIRIFVPEGNTSEDVLRIHTAAGMFMEYFANLLRSCEKGSNESLTSIVASAVQRGDISEIEAVATLRGMFTAGFETTAASIAALLLCLSNDPSLLVRFRQTPELIEPSIDELLRWESPVQLVTRSVTTPTQLGNDLITPDHTMWLMIGSANHDDHHYQDPNKFNPGRADIVNLAFGGGRHRCAGAALAKLELVMTLRGLVNSVESVVINPGEVVRSRNFQFRSIKALRAEFVIK